jgi:two-component system, response regulator YesN
MRTEHTITDLKIAAAIEYMKANLHESNLSLTRVSQSVRLSPCYFSRHFKRRTGIGYHDFLIALRLKHASVLLATTILNIKEIAFCVGYRHISDFDHHFKRFYSMPPGEYRLRHKKIDCRSGLI